MMIGTITARHILRHPLTIIKVLGLLGYMRLIANCVGRHPHCFTDFILK